MLRITIIGLLGLWLVACTSQDMAALPLEKDPAELAATKVQATPVAATSDKIVDFEGATMVTATPEASTPALPGTRLIEFSTDEPGWYTVDDNVMGGVSRSNVDTVDPGILIFSGTMSLDNNGGFASARSDWALTDLGRYDGLLLRVLGDGKSYRLRIRSAVTGPDIAYNAIFQTTPGTWELVYVPFAEMVPTYRGFVMDVGALDPKRIGSFGFMLSDKQPGDFELLVDWIYAVSEDEMKELVSKQAAD